jgi:hypothetical protein
MMPPPAEAAGEKASRITREATARINMTQPLFALSSVRNGSESYDRANTKPVGNHCYQRVSDEGRFHKRVED